MKWSAGEDHPSAHAAAVLTAETLIRLRSFLEALAKEK